MFYLADVHLLDQRMISVRLDEVSHLITRELTTAVETIGRFPSTLKAISALLPFAARQDQHGSNVTLNTLLHVARASEVSIWSCIVPALFNEASPLIIVLVSPYVDWHDPLLADRGSLLTQWAAAATAVPYTEEIGRCVVDVLLYVSIFSFLLSHVPVGMWGWLERRPTLPPKCRGRTMGGDGCVVRYVRALGDIKILKSYLLLTWSEWDAPWPSALPEVCGLIRVDFSGAEMRGHREDLIEHLDHVLGQLDRGLEYLQQQKPRLYPMLYQEAKEGYKMIRDVLLEVDRGALWTRTPPGMITLLAC